jgi:hypothetical protein
MKNLITIIAIMLLTIINANADVRKITFENKEEVAVDDLHIRFTRNNVEWDNDEPHTFDNVRHNVGQSDYNFWGTTIPAGGTAELTFEGPGDIEIAEWWWTKGGNALKNGDKVGKSKKDNGGAILSFQGGPATGNGMYMVSLNGQLEMFQTQPGMLPPQTMNMFMGFIQTEFNSGGNQLIYTVPQSPQSLYIAANTTGDSTKPLILQVAQVDLTQPLYLTPFLPSRLNLTTLIEGRYNHSQNKMKSDYIDVTFRSQSPPFNNLYTTTCWLDSTGKAEAWTYGIPDGLPFFIQVNHRNTVETWSANGNNMFVAKTCAYNFTLSAGSAFGANQKLLGTKFCLYSGDTNQDDVVDGTDMSSVDNDAANYASGYLPTDLTGDDAVDATDYAITDNNASAFVGVVRP